MSYCLKLVIIGKHVNRILNNLKHKCTVLFESHICLYFKEVKKNQLLIVFVIVSLASGDNFTIVAPDTLCLMSL